LGREGIIVKVSGKLFEQDRLECGKTVTKRIIEKNYWDCSYENKDNHSSDILLHLPLLQLASEILVLF
jgi:hypothetical protein